jgi:hypothetical protein
MWTPILPASASSTVWAALEAIESLMTTAELPVAVEQYWGRALFFAYLSIAQRDKNNADRSFESLDQSLQAASRLEDYSRRSGLAGVAWTVQHLARAVGSDDIDAGGPRSPVEDFLNKVDSVLRASALDPTQRQTPFPYGLAAGAGGVGLYFLERLPSPHCRDALALLVDTLRDTSVAVCSGRSWRSGVDGRADWNGPAPPSFYDLTVVDGVPGLLHLLYELAELDNLRQACLDLGAKALLWLTSTQPAQAGFSRYSPWLADGFESPSSRLAWCQGDLGIMAILTPIARNLRDDALKRHCDDLLERCLMWPSDMAGVTDASLCHGAAGIGHVYNRLYQAFGDERCRRAAVEWLCYAAILQKDAASRLLKVRQPPVDLSFFTGLSGTALALLAAVTPVEPAWDRLLLLSPTRR